MKKTPLIILFLRRLSPKNIKKYIEDCMRVYNASVPMPPGNKWPLSKDEKREVRRAAWQEYKKTWIIYYDYLREQKREIAHPYDAQAVVKASSQPTAQSDQQESSRRMMLRAGEYFREYAKLLRYSVKEFLGGFRDGNRGSPLSAPTSAEQVSSTSSNMNTTAPSPQSNTNTTTPSSQSNQSSQQITEQSQSTQSTKP